MYFNKDIFYDIKQQCWDNQETYKENYKFQPLGAVFFTAYDVIAAHTEDFNADEAAEKLAKTHTKPTDKYFGMSKEDILASWNDKNKKSLQTGNGLDDYITALWQKKPLPMINHEMNPESIARENKLRIQADEFYKRMSNNPDIDFVGASVWLNSFPFGFRGVADTILWNNKAKSILILDSKQNEKIDRNAYGKIMKGVMAGVPQNDVNKMTLQLFPYMYAIEKLGYKVGGSALVHYTEDGYNLIKPDIKYDPNLVEHMFHQTRKWKIAKLQKLADEKAALNDDNNALGSHERPKF